MNNLLLLLAQITSGHLTTAVVGILIGAVIYFVIGRLTGTYWMGKAKYQAEQLVQIARSESETIKKQIELDVRTDLAKLREAHERETSRTRRELDESDRRLTKQEDNLERKLAVLTIKEKHLDGLDAKTTQREKTTAEKDARLDQLIAEQKENTAKAIASQKQTLLRLSNLSPEEARKEALQLVEEEVQHDAALLIQRQSDLAEQECKENAIRITLQAIQRYASDHTADVTVSTVTIPSDDMKGRVIGREGRNIRAFEKATGVDVIVDDTPGVILVSCFDPVRRAIATDSLHKLIEDGRIHPVRIEEIVEKTQKEMKDRIVMFGRDAAIESNIQGLDPHISEAMGRLHYRTSYGQNILRHSLEVAYLCQVIADELGLDGSLARRCGYLHDIGKAMDHDIAGGHPGIGADFCKKFGEKQIVLNAIAGHHNDIPATSPYTPIVMAADTTSGARPGARRESLERYIKRLEELEDIATSMNGVKQAFAIQAGREVRVIVDPSNVDDSNCVYIARNIAKRVSEEMTFPGEIRITVLREMRTVEYAR